MSLIWRILIDCADRTKNSFSVEDEDYYPTFSEFSVMIAKADNLVDKPVILTVWAASLEEAMDCGEILSGVYL